MTRRQGARAWFTRRFVVSRTDVSARDPYARHMNDPTVRDPQAWERAPEPTDREAALDEALAQTFPASDPIACTPKSLAELRMLGRLST